MIQENLMKAFYFSPNEDEVTPVLANFCNGPNNKYLGALLAMHLLLRVLNSTVLSGRKAGKQYIKEWCNRVAVGGPDLVQEP